MLCAAPEGQKSALCTGLIPMPLWEEYQCSYCARAGARAALLGERLRSDRARIGEFMRNPDVTAKTLAQNGLALRVPTTSIHSQQAPRARSEKERKGWEKYLRSQFRPSHGPAAWDAPKLIGTWAQKQWSKMVEVILAELFAEQLGDGRAPCDFAVCVTGSLARREACPYSDVECFILIEQSGKADFFKRVGTYVNNLLYTSLEGHRGICFDEELSPAENAIHPAVHTPFDWCQYLVTEIEHGNDAKRGVLTDFRFIYGKPALFEEVVNSIRNFRDLFINQGRQIVLREFENEIIGRIGGTDSVFGQKSPYAKSEKGVAHLKYQYYRWLEQIPRYLCEYYKAEVEGDRKAKLEVIGARKQVEALYQAGYISGAFADQMQKAIEAVARLRVNVQLEAGLQEHEVLRKAPPPEANPLPRTHLKNWIKEGPDGSVPEFTGEIKHVLTPGETRQLDMIHRTVNLMLKTSLEFIAWARDNHVRILEIEKNPTLEKGFKLRRPKRKVPPSPFQAKVANIDIPDLSRPYLFELGKGRGDV